MKGISSNHFAPDEKLTRGMLVTILYRAEDEPAINKSIPFEDVEPDKYCFNAISWAQQNGIINGKSTSILAPKENATRIETAAILYRFLAD